MKKILFIPLFLTMTLFGKLNVVVSILPEKTFLEAIGGDKVNVALMVMPGNSPHTYEPKPSQMIDIAQAQLYFAIDVEFESVWLPKFQSLNPKMKVVDLDEGIEKMVMEEQEHEAHIHHSHDHHGEDPHIWTTPHNVKHIAQNIATQLQTIDPANAEYYQHNLDLFVALAEQTDQKIRQIFSSFQGGETFMVLHPSWGYFAKAYGLRQIAVEIEGKEPKPKELIHLLKEAREAQVKAIFIQPEFSDNAAKIIAKELEIPVIKVTPLAADWSENLLMIAKAIATGK
jgi:zinc transport system substrate-binding protein